MTNKPMLSVERELLEIYTGRKEGDWVEAGHELRALLDKQSCGACGGCDNGCKLDRESPTIEPAAQQQGEPVAICRLWNEGGSGERTSVEFIGEPCADGTLLYAEQPAPVAVVHTMHSVMEITQEASQFYVPGTSNWCGHIANRLNGVMP